MRFEAFRDASEPTDDNKVVIRCMMGNLVVHEMLYAEFIKYYPHVVLKKEGK